MDNTNLANFDNYKRIMLKLSGEVLVGNQEYGIEADTPKRIKLNGIFLLNNI